jgi:hypothetical protein
MASMGNRYLFDFIFKYFHLGIIKNDFKYLIFNVKESISSYPTEDTPNEYLFNNLINKFKRRSNGTKKCE